jgi:hypothetical protein
VKQTKTTDATYTRLFTIPRICFEINDIGRGARCYIAWLPMRLNEAIAPGWGM